LPPGPATITTNLKEGLEMNINNLKKAQLHGARVVTDGGHVALHSVSRAYGFGRPPSWEENTDFTPETATKLDPAARDFVDDPLSLAASRVMLALPALDHATQQILSDARLSASGRVEKLREPRTAAIKAIATAGRDIAANGSTLDAREAAHLQPSAIDMQTELQHRERRDHFRTLPANKRTPLLESMAQGKADPLLEALVRSPVPLEDHEAALVQSAWRDAVARREPKRAAELQAARANHDWAQSVVAAAAQYAPRSTMLTPAEITDAARGTGGESIFFDGMRTDHAA
jgi:hypothetical protein